MIASVVALFIAGTDKFLLLHRAPGQRHVGWCLPGGREVYDGEPPVWIAVRELQEETGITLLPEELSYATVMQAEHGETVHVFWAGVREAQAITLSDEHDDWKWTTTLSANNYAGRTAEFIAAAKVDRSYRLED
jgi:8-oxo-dGTP diphosphatase